MLCVANKPIMPIVVMLNLVYAKCIKQANYAECCYAECHYAECRGATGNHNLTAVAKFL